MIELYGAVLVASLLGSLHCAGMCGPFAALACAPQMGGAPVQVGRRLGGSPFAVHAAYHGGRLITYMMLGAAAGLAGAAVNFGGDLIGLQRAATICAGGVMILFGVVALLQVLGWRIPLPTAAAWLQAPLRQATQRAYRLPPGARSLMIGLTTALLPCGWLYAFVVTASGTAHPAWGALLMASFWLGTLPVLGTLGLGAGVLLRRFGARIPLLTSLMLIAVGVLTAAGRLRVDADALRRVASRPTDLNGAVQQVKSLDSAKLPCCKD